MFRINELVNVRDNGIGLVEEIIHNDIKDIDIYIVHIADTNRLVKCLESDLSPIEDTDPLAEEKTVTISRKRLIEIIGEVNVGDIMLRHIEDPDVALLLVPVITDISFALIEAIMDERGET